MTILFATTYPERVAAAILYGTGPSYRRASDYPWAGDRESYLTAAAERERRWGDPAYFDELLEEFAPSVAADPEIKRWWGRYARTSASPRAAANLMRMNADWDVRYALPTMRVPTLILHWRDEHVFPVECARYMAERIPGAELVELPGEDHAWFVKPEQIAQEVQNFLEELWQRGEWNLVETDRVLATVLFTDIVGSTAKAVELGDAGWRELLERYRALIRRHLVRYRGRELNTAGDGVFASFDGPARAIRCACAIADGVEELGLEVRAGLHTGECELMNGKVGGIAVHIGARVASEAGAGEVLVSGTVKDLVAGSDLRFEERGLADLKGLPGEWRLFAVVR